MGEVRLTKGWPFKSGITVSMGLGPSFNWSIPIINQFEMARSGSRGQLISKWTDMDCTTAAGDS